MHKVGRLRVILDICTHFFYDWQTELLIETSLEIHEGDQPCACPKFVLYHITYKVFLTLFLLKSPFCPPAPLLNNDTTVTIQEMRIHSLFDNTQIINIY